MSEASQYSVIYFDGHCNLCNGFVTYVIKRDPNAKFRFAALQAKTPDNHEEVPRGTDGSFESMLLEKNGTIYKYSDAVLNTFTELKGPSKLLAVFKIIPKPLRDRLYRWIARKRYWIFGKTEQCMIPTPEIMNRFLTEMSE